MPTRNNSEIANVNECPSIWHIANPGRGVMLVMSRKQTECIRVADNIVITVLRIRGHKVQIGIDAPQTVRVVRAELLDQSLDEPLGFVPDAA